MSHLTLVRGLPGSGKSTLAAQLSVSGIWVEADMFFRAANGHYQFNPASLKAAHKWCQDKASFHLLRGDDVIVSNTFTQMWEMKPYLNMAYDSLQVIECHGQFKNIHNVPEDVIQRMKDRWEQYVY